MIRLLMFRAGRFLLPVVSILDRFSHGGRGQEAQALQDVDAAREKRLKQRSEERVRVLSVCIKVGP